MPAFGKDGIVNINSTAAKTTYYLVKPDGVIVASGDNKDVLLAKKNDLSQSAGCNLELKEKKLECI